MSGIRNICELVGDKEIWHKPNILKNSIASMVSTKIQSVYDNEWSHRISTSQPKLRTYCKFKSTFECENYLHILNRSQRSLFCKLRISAHNLKIETGRHSIPRIPPENRFCEVCTLNEVEDEFHFVMKCTAYNRPRRTLLSSLQECLNINTNSDAYDIFINIMHASDFDIVQIIAK